LFFLGNIAQTGRRKRIDYEASTFRNVIIAHEIVTGRQRGELAK